MPRRKRERTQRPRPSLSRARALRYLKSRLGKVAYDTAISRLGPEYVAEVGLSSFKRVLDKIEREDKEQARRIEKFRTEEGGKLGRGEIKFEVQRLRFQRTKKAVLSRPRLVPSSARGGWYEYIVRGKVVRRIRGARKVKRAISLQTYWEKVDKVADSLSISRGDAVRLFADAKRRAVSRLNRLLKTKRVKDYIRRHPKSKKYSKEQAKRSATILIWKAAGVEGTPAA